MKLINQLGILFVTGIIVAGCVSTSGLERDSYAKYTIAGKRIEVATYWHIRPNCENYDLPVVQVISAPKSGKVNIATEGIFPGEKAYEKCKSVPVKGIVVYYTANSCFSGTDVIKLRTAFSNGEIQEDTINVDVK